MKLLAIIPARGGSKRLPLKNFREFFCKPVIGWVTDEVIKSELFDKVIITTDHPEWPTWEDDISRLIIHKRSPELASDTATVDDVCLDVLEIFNLPIYEGQIIDEQGSIACKSEYDYLCVIYPTAYAVTWTSLCSSLSLMIKKNALYCYSYGMVNGKYKLDNGGFYWVKVSEFLKSKTVFNPKGVGYELPMVDINTIQDFADAKLHALGTGKIIINERFKCPNI